MFVKRQQTLFGTKCIILIFSFHILVRIDFCQKNSYFSHNQKDALLLPKVIQKYLKHKTIKFVEMNVFYGHDLLVVYGLAGFRKNRTFLSRSWCGANLTPCPSWSRIGSNQRSLFLKDLLIGKWWELEAILARPILPELEHCSGRIYHKNKRIKWLQVSSEPK